MLTTKISGTRKRAWSGWALLAMMAMLCACQPPGAKALLDGERLIQEKEYERALRRLNKAVSLLPGNPQVWNHLGLAYHGLDRPEQAARAYLQALTIDRNLAPAHFNLGCLFLEQNRLPESITELTIFTTLQPEHAEGWLKLGTAQLRARRPDDAERSFLNGLRRAPKNPELHNNLALAHLQRKRPREAVQALNASLQHDPAYAPALLNQAVVAESYMGNKPAALQRYQAYLDRRPPNAAAVRMAVDRLEREMGRPEPSVTPAEAVATVVSNLASASTSAVASAVRPAASTNLPSPVLPPPPQTGTALVQVAAIKPEAALPQTVSETKPPSAPTRPVIAPAATNTLAAAPPVVEPPKTAAPEPELAPLEVVSVATEPSVKRAADPDDPLSPSGTVLRAPSPPGTRTAPASVPASVPSIPQRDAASAPANPPADEPPLLAPRKAPEERPGLLERINPATWFRRDEPGRSAPPPRIYARAVPNPSEEAAQPERPSGPRYPYRRDLTFPQGNRVEAERVFSQAAEAHQQNRLATAVELYQRAIAEDPSYFEARYNLGLAAYQSRDLPLALGASEEAVALRGSAPNARYNFAVVLREANYFEDAVRELNQVLTVTPGDARAHLAAANILAEQLGQPAEALRHYRRVLELEPNHPEAARIRAWMAGQR